MPFSPYRLSNRVEPLALAPWLLAALGAAAALAVAWTLCVWAFVFIPPIFFVRTALGLAACVTVGVFFSATVCVCLQEGKLRHPRAVFGLTVGLAAAGLLAHVAAWRWLFPQLPYGPQLVGGLCLVAFTTVYGGWFALREELFCESCREWGVRQRSLLTVPGDDPARFLEELASQPLRSRTEEEREAAKRRPNSTLDLWACPCGQTCALTATSHDQDDRAKIRLRFVALPAELAARIRSLRVVVSPDDGADDDPDPEALFREGRPVYRSWGLDAGLWLLGAIVAGFAAVAVACAAGFLYVLWRRTNGLPEAPPLGLGLQDLFFTGLILGVASRPASRQLRQALRAARAELSIELYPDRIEVAMARAGWSTEIALEEIQDAQLAEFHPRRERRRLASGSMRSNVLATALFLRSGGDARGVRLQLRGQETVCLGLEQPERFLAALATARRLPSPATA